MFIAITGSFFSAKNTKGPWYDCMKSSITPPGYIFGIVWTILYIILIIVYAKILLEKNKVLITVITINLLLNILWCYIYFTLKKPIAAYVVLVAILISNIYILINIKNKAVFAMFIPYVLWILFAFILSSLSLNKKCI
jgi:tryptophan-rich sensory protein